MKAVAKTKDVCKAGRYDRIIFMETFFFLKIGLLEDRKKLMALKKTK